MAAAPKTLTERLEAIINTPGLMTPVKGALIKLLRSVKLLESGHAARKKEAKIAALKAENEDLKIQLQAMQAQIEQYQTEQTDQTEPQMPPVQFDILNRLSHESGYGDRLNEIAAAAKITVDEAEIHMDRLRKAGFAKRADNTYGGGDWLWRRTMAGNEYVVAKRLAGEAEIPERYRRKYTDLAQKQHEAVLAMAAHDGSADVGQIAAEIGASIFQTEYVLQALKKAGMATSGDEPQATYGAPEDWWLLEPGKDYLAERNLL